MKPSQRNEEESVIAALSTCIMTYVLRNAQNGSRASECQKWHTRMIYHKKILFA